jgi:ornithine carbamoyltransferase
MTTIRRYAAAGVAGAVRTAAPCTEPLRPLKPGPRGRRHLLSIADLSDSELRAIVQRGADLAAGAEAGQPLRGMVVATYFRKTSTRTRTAFTRGAMRLGASVMAYGPNDLQENTGETLEDTGRVLSGMVDALVTRNAGPPEELRALACQDRMSVINAMTADEHPTQALADLSTMTRWFGGLEGLRMCYVGEGNNTAAALALAMARCPDARLRLLTPVGFGLGSVLARAQRAAARSGALIEEYHDPTALPDAADVIYTTRWQTTGTEKPVADWRPVFEPFRVDAALMDRYPDSIFMHDLPAHRGEEVTADVLDGPRSIAFEQAEGKLYGAMAVLEFCLLERYETTFP